MREMKLSVTELEDGRCVQCDNQSVLELGIENSVAGLLNVALCDICAKILLDTAYDVLNKTSKSIRTRLENFLLSEGFEYSKMNTFKKMIQGVGMVSVYFSNTILTIRMEYPGMGEKEVLKKKFEDLEELEFENTIKKLFS
jgi:hypothetical protein